MEKYRCMGCSYMYDPCVGEPDKGIIPGTSFENVPESWACPGCGVAKHNFEEVT